MSEHNLRGVPDGIAIVETNTGRFPGVPANVIGVEPDPRGWTVDFFMQAPHVSAVMLMARVILSPVVAKQLAVGLIHALQIYENNHGEIEMPAGAALPAGVPHGKA